MARLTFPLRTLVLLGCGLGSAWGCSSNGEAPEDAEAGAGAAGQPGTGAAGSGGAGAGSTTSSAAFDGAGDACDPTAGGQPVSPALAGLVHDVRGFAEGTVGGAHGCVYHVTDLGDAGDGTLRAGLERGGPWWIVFDVDGTIELNSPIEVTSDKTVDGRGAAIEIRGRGLLIENASVSNVIVENVIFGGGDGDAIAVYRGPSSIWIDHCSFSAWGDGQVDITEAATDVTVSWSYFHDHEIGMLVGARPDATEDALIRATIHHNRFERVDERSPRARFGKVHVANNLFVDWGGYAIGASQRSEVAADSNIFVAGRNKIAIRDIVGSDPEHGSVRTTGAWLLEGATALQTNPDSVFLPEDFYDLELDPANTTLRAKLEGHAGAR